MGLVGCFAAPHPPIVVPEVGGADLADAEATVRAMIALREKTAALDPDTIVLLSPHSPLARSQMGVSLAAKYKGSLAYFRAPQVRVDVDGDVRLAEALMQAHALADSCANLGAKTMAGRLAQFEQMLAEAIGGAAVPAGGVPADRLAVLTAALNALQAERQLLSAAVAAALKG